MRTCHTSIILLKSAICLALIPLFISCSSRASDANRYSLQGRKVEVVKAGGKFTLYKDGEPYFIKGAAGYEHFDRVKAYGGNSVRVWHTDDAKRILDEAHANGLTVMLGLWMEREREGFNYYDKEDVAAQKERLRQEVLKYKDHPALLMWVVGNELYAEGSNVKVWDAVNGIAEMIHEVDPDHPTTTTVMNVPLKVVNLIKRRCPAIDILSINAFGSMHNLPDEIKETDWDGPYVIAEFGGRGYWEAYTTWWYAPIEQTSSEKAAFARANYKRTVLGDKDRCLGAYVFIWGYKYETTPTWFSLMTETGEETELVQVMRELWTGKSDFNKAPHVAYLSIKDIFPSDQVYLKPGEECTAAVYATDPDGDPLQVKWEVLPETVSEDGNTIKQEKPELVQGVLGAAEGAKVVVKAPRKDGAYRLYAYVYDGQGNVATANFPFYVKTNAAYSSALDFY
ncbi:glycoside hydrolase family 2 TIM barrel-domain containing protein [Pontibacter roseus]|uniref:glycoside hydrolase family 2 TIM barrel-domain containing protein n=1 Tax=Pontibacter roseus TaxID=336989 RepID=UPI00035CCDC9|nr:glycoside hydrolase family 2 TIM barrel-domain containing protein [Pontibacter roseus]